MYDENATLMLDALSIQQYTNISFARMCEDNIFCEELSYQLKAAEYFGTIYIHLEKRDKWRDLYWIMQ